MPEITPIPNSPWINIKCRRTVRVYFPIKNRLTLYLPINDILPEHMATRINIPVELMLACLLHGAWIKEDWKVYVRYTIANRLLKRKDVIFTPSFEKIQDDFIDFQLNGGTFKNQLRFKQVASRIIQNPLSTQLDTATAKLILSTMDEVQLNTLIQPFHWIRTAVGFSDPCSAFGANLALSEMRKQKSTLCKMLRS